MILSKFVNQQRKDSGDEAAADDQEMIVSQRKADEELASTDGSSVDDDSCDDFNPSSDQESIEDADAASDRRYDEDEEQGNDTNNGHGGSWNKVMLLSSLINSASQAARITTSRVANQAARLQVTNMAGKAGKAAKIQSHIATLRAGLTIWDHEMKVAKHQFGIDCFDIMERNRSMGDPSGGEAEPEIVRIFVKAMNDMDPLYKCRRDKLQKLKQPTTEISVDSEQSSSTASRAGLPVLDRRSSRNVYDEQNCNIYDTCKIDDDVDDEKSKKITVSNPLLAGQRLLVQRWHQAQESYSEFSQQSSVKKSLKEIDKEVLLRKQKFGIDMYGAMIKAANMIREADMDVWEPRDAQIKELFNATREKISEPQRKREVANREINDLEENGCILVSHSEVMEFVLDNPRMYVPLSDNTGIPQRACQRIAVYVAIELIRTSTGGQWRQRRQGGNEDEDEYALILTKRKFTSFIQNYVNAKSGAQEFYLRCLFEICDDDADGYLSRNQVELFLDDPIFRDDSLSSAQLKRFKERAWNHLIATARENAAQGLASASSSVDEDGDNTASFSFENVYQVIRSLTRSGHNQASGDTILRKHVSAMKNQLFSATSS